MDEPAPGDVAPPSPATDPQTTRRRACRALAVVVLALYPLGACHRSGPEEVRRWTILPPEDLQSDHDLGPPELSPDGERIAFAGLSPDGTSHLWVQKVGSLEASEVQGTEGASYPFWSPDGRSLGFFAGEKLRRIDLDRGTPKNLADVLVPNGGSWSRDGTILFAPGLDGVIHRVAASGGAVTAATALDPARGETAHMHPQAVPDGRSFLFLAVGTPDDEAVDGGAIRLGSLDSATTRFLVAAPSAPRYSSSGHLLYLRDRTLVAAALDLRSGELSSEATVVARDLGPTPRAGTPASVSENGRLLYQSQILSKTSVLTWTDRRGQLLGTVGRPDDYQSAVLSHDQHRIATSINDPLTGAADIWTIDLERGTSSRLTFESRNDFSPAWSPDDRRIYYFSDVSTQVGTYVRSVESGAEAELVFAGEGFHLLWSLSPDDRTGWLLVDHFSSGTRWDIERLDLESGTTEPFLDGPDRESGPEVSPDGRWLAFHSDESGRQEVYVVSTEAPDVRHRISRDGGSHARWSRGGRELVFRAPDGFLVAAAIRTDPTFAADPPVRLFDGRERPNVGNHFSVTSDGERFLLNRAAEPQVDPWVLVENWTAELAG